MSEIKLNKKVIDLIGEYGHVKYQHKSDIVTLDVWQDLINAIKDWHADALAARDARIAELEAYICYADEVSTCAEQLLKMIQIDACDVTKDMVAVLRLDAALKELESFDNTCADGDATATPSEYVWEGDDFASVLRDEIQRVFDYGRQNYRGCMNETIEQLQVQYSRIVAAKDAEIAALHQLCDDRFNEIAELRAQPARQVGGDEPVAWHTDDHLDDKSATTYDKVVAERWVAKGWPVTPLYRAALAPAAVVMPERSNLDFLTGTAWEREFGRHEALDEVARLNRRVIPVELLKRIVAHADRPNQLTPGIGAPNHSHKVRGKWDQDGAHCDICADWDELRALLGKY